MTTFTGKWSLGKYDFVSLSTLLTICVALLCARTASISAHLVGTYGGPVADQSALVTFLSSDFWNCESICVCSVAWSAATTDWEQLSPEFESGGWSMAFCERLDRLNFWVVGFLISCWYLECQCFKITDFLSFWIYESWMFRISKLLDFGVSALLSFWNSAIWVSEILSAWFSDLLCYRVFEICIFWVPEHVISAQIKWRDSLQVPILQHQAHHHK